MKKKGFTLIELLAVIVILAIIALILTPMIQNLIFSVRESAKQRSIEGHIKNIEYAIINREFDQGSADLSYYDMDEGTEKVDELTLPSNDYIVCNSYKIREGKVLEAHSCADISKSWETGYDYKIGEGISVGELPDAIQPGSGYEFTGDTESGSGSETNSHFQTFVVPQTGIYKLEVWGAQGGSCTTSGKGGYAEGYAPLTKGDVIAIVTGTQGNGLEGGYNGGGQGGSNRSQTGSGGGGATHMAIYNEAYTTLDSYVTPEIAEGFVLIVAGGGGGCPEGGAEIAGHGGGTFGTKGYDSHNNSYATYNGLAGSYTKPGETANNAECGKGSFGKGGNYCNDNYGGSGGGGGYYGGGGSSRGSHSGGGGGSSYINSGISKPLTKIGIQTGDGKANITYIGKKIPSSHTDLAIGTTYTFNYNGTLETEYSDGSIQELEIYQTGIYKLEVWGASGGPGGNNKRGGYGAYATGKIKLYEGDKLYIGVGGQGIGDGKHGIRNGGYNGGGNATSNSDGNTRQASGGGATHIAIAENLGELKNYNVQRDEIIIVAAGGGSASGNSALNYANGGNAGGFKGQDAEKVRQGNSAWNGIGATYTGNFTFGAGLNGYAGGGGSGFFGGTTNYAGGGGVSYIGMGPFTRLYEKGMFCYGCEEQSEDLELFTVSTTTGALRDSSACPDGVSTSPVSKCAKQGNGYAKITFISN